MAKRTFDVLASVAVLAVLWPLLLLVAAWVRLDSPGPALFRQERVGLRGELFTLLKFRTMAATPLPGGPLVTAAGDRRVTRAGRWLRPTKLDELPQLLNVLAGDMSLVGPRPEVPRYVTLWPPQQRDLILSVRPGITDEAAVVFRDEERLLAAAADPELYYVEEILPRKLALYVAYVRGRSFGGDLRLLARTGRVLLKRDEVPSR
ncbi:MAG: sugar transferase [Gammaproteobacteria bacterium]|nr:sugar transferase [Gammaproteobacteria bacterium]